MKIQTKVREFDNVRFFKMEGNNAHNSSVHAKPISCKQNFLDDAKYDLVSPIGKFHSFVVGTYCHFLAIIELNIAAGKHEFDLYLLGAEIKQLNADAEFFFAGLSWQLDF